jgi:hypothetical protein
VCPPLRFSEFCELSLPRSWPLSCDESWCDRIIRISECLRRRSFLYAGISSRSSERGDKASCSLERTTRENQCHSGFDEAQFQTIRSGSVIAHTLKPIQFDSAASRQPRLSYPTSARSPLFPLLLWCFADWEYKEAPMCLNCVRIHINEFAVQNIS